MRQREGRPGMAARRLMAPHRLVLVRAGMALRAIAWRAGHVRRRANERGARALLRLILAVPRLRRLPRRTILAVERRLLSSVDNAHFNPAHYLACNPDVQQAGVDPLTHYLADGWAEGRNPSPGFDDPGYRRQAGLGPHVRVSALALWHVLGRRRGLGPSRHAARRASPASLSQALSQLPSGPGSAARATAAASASSSSRPRRMVNSSGRASRIEAFTAIMRSSVGT